MHLQFTNRNLILQGNPRLIHLLKFHQFCVLIPAISICSIILRVYLHPQYISSNTNDSFRPVEYALQSVIYKEHKEPIYGKHLFWLLVTFIFQQEKEWYVTTHGVKELKSMNGTGTLAVRVPN